MKLTIKYRTSREIDRVFFPIGINAEKLALRMKVATPTVYYWLATGQVPEPRIEELKKIKLVEVSGRKKYVFKK